MKRRGLLAIAMIAVSLLALPWPAAGQDEVRVKAIDRYISVFGGIALPLKTDVAQGGAGGSFTARDVKLDISRSIGGKIGMYTTQYRSGTGLDFGYELDITNFTPN